MNVTAAHSKKGRKYDQVLEGAREVFMADGFEGASVDNIVKAAGVSKATLYSYFPDKRHLFTEVAHCECQRQSANATTNIDMTAPAAQVLRAAANHMIGFFTSKFGLQMFRICVAESVRFPELGQEFYKSGPIRLRDSLVLYFEQAIARGELKIDDVDLAAHQFAELCKSVIFQRMIFGVQTKLTQPEIDRVADGAVDMFMARYGVKS
ncbi:MAG: TetR/AcrR family transcriptional regulator [Paracoccaceae bacterium]